MVQKKTVSGRIFDWGNAIVMLLLIFITLAPLLHVVTASFSDNNEVLKTVGILFWPKGFTTASYQEVFKNHMIWRGYGNTIFIVVAGTSLNIVMTSLGAYFLSRRNVTFKKAVMIAIVFTMYFSGGLIPSYFNIRDLGMYDSIWALIIPGAISTYNMIIMRTAFAAIPVSLEEAARIDGASHFTVLFRIVVPLSLPTIAVMVLYYGVGHWNSWFSAMIYLRDRTLYPLQLILREILINGRIADTTQAGVDQVPVSETIKYATIVVATVPILCVYPFIQKYFVKGVMIGAIKE